MLAELLRDGAVRSPERALVAGPDRVLTYAAALERAEAYGRGLRARGIDRFAAVVADPAELLGLLCGAAAVGSEACVLRPTVEDDLARELLARFEQSHLIADRPVDVPGVEQVDLGSLPEPGEALRDAPASAPLLVLTTGTTGLPKGARHDWARLVAGARRSAGPADARWLLTYNLNQFGGLQILLHVLASGATLVVPASNRPDDAIAAMREHRVTHASGTPTFWRFAVPALERAHAELALEQITLGGEAASAPVLEALRRLFPRARVSHVYAATEFGSAISVRDGEIGIPASALERGEDALVQLRIVDGELHARSSVGMLGYYGEAESDGGWRPTGDLVEVRGDRIVFVGRTSETINVGGVKVHPLPVEEVVAGVEGVVLAHVYGRANPLTGQIVAVDVVPAPGADTDDLGARIRAACGSLPPAAQPRRVRFVEAIDVRDNKVARRAPAP